MKKLNFKKGLPAQAGFTFIEILVVVGLLGILASIVFVTLNDARLKGSDSSVKSALDAIRKQAELQYSTYLCYTNDGTSCSNVVSTQVAKSSCSLSTAIFVIPDMVRQLAEVQKNSSGFYACYEASSGTAWSVIAQFKSDESKGWCVDSTGKSKSVSIANPYNQSKVNKVLSDTTDNLCP